MFTRAYYSLHQQEEVAGDTSFKGHTISTQPPPPCQQAAMPPMNPHSVAALLARQQNSSNLFSIHGGKCYLTLVNSLSRIRKLVLDARMVSVKRDFVEEFERNMRNPF